MSCKSCGCSPCQCAPSALANPIISGGVFNGPVINGPTINGGTINDANLVSVHLDLASTGETSAPGVCNEALATNAFVCTAIANAITSLNPAFCNAVADCILANAALLCPSVAFCIQTTPGIINSTSAFGALSRATTTAYGVVRYSTVNEFEQAQCLVAIDPCTLANFWNLPNLASPMWLAFANAVNLVLTTGSPAFCAAVFACGAAPLANPIFTGDPRAPTPAPGDNDTSIATTAFVQQAIASYVSGGNPAFCAAVTACGGGGGGGGGGASCTPEVVARGRFQLDTAPFPINAGPGPLGFTVNCAISYNNPTNGWVTITLANVAANVQYDVVANGYFVAQFPFAPDPTTLVFTLQPQAGVGPAGTGLAQVDFIVVESRVCGAASGPGNFASVTLGFSTDGSGNYLGGSAGVVANYGCSALVGIGGPFTVTCDVTFNTPQPDGNYSLHSMTAITPPASGAVGWVGLLARAGIRTVNGALNLSADVPLSPGEPNTAYSTTFVFSR